MNNRFTAWYIVANIVMALIAVVLWGFSLVFMMSREISLPLCGISWFGAIIFTILAIALWQGTDFLLTHHEIEKNEYELSGFGKRYCKKCGWPMMVKVIEYDPHQGTPLRLSYSCFGSLLSEGHEKDKIIRLGEEPVEEPEIFPET